MQHKVNVKFIYVILNAYCFLNFLCLTANFCSVKSLRALVRKFDYNKQTNFYYEAQENDTFLQFSL